MADGLALPLAGGPIAFAAAELIEGAPGEAKRRLFSAPALVQSKDPDLAAVLERVIAERPPFAGLRLDRPVLMGIVNVTPDSFSDGGLYDTKEDAIAHAAELAVREEEVARLLGVRAHDDRALVEAADLLERSGDSVGIAGELDGGGVRQELALSRNGRLDETAEE